MKHKLIRKKLLRYLDNDLPENEQQEIQAHMVECPSCRAHLQWLKSSWQTEQSISRITAPPFLWTRFLARLNKEERSPMIVRIAGQFFQYARPAIVTAVIVLMVYIGVQFGQKIILPKTESTLSGVQTSQIRTEFGMDYFSALPPGSVGEPLITLTVNK